MPKGEKGLAERLRHYFRVTIWLREPPPGLKGWVIRNLRIGVMILEGSARLGLFRMAAGLSFVSLLAAAPLAVAGLNLLKGMGALQPAIDSLQGREGGFNCWIRT